MTNQISPYKKPTLEEAKISLIDGIADNILRNESTSFSNFGMNVGVILSQDEAEVILEALNKLPKEEIQPTRAVEVNLTGKETAIISKVLESISGAYPKGILEEQRIRLGNEILIDGVLAGNVTSVKEFEDRTEWKAVISEEYKEKLRNGRVKPNEKFAIRIS